MKTITYKSPWVMGDKVWIIDGFSELYISSGVIIGYRFAIGKQHMNDNNGDVLTYYVKLSCTDITIEKVYWASLPNEKPTIFSTEQEAKDRLKQVYGERREERIKQLKQAITLKKKQLKQLEQL